MCMRLTNHVKLGSRVQQCLLLSNDKDIDGVGNSQKEISRLVEPVLDDDLCFDLPLVCSACLSAAVLEPVQRELIWKLQVFARTDMSTCRYQHTSVASVQL